MTTENFKGIHRLRAFPDDVAYMFADREVVRDCDAEYFNGGKIDYFTSEQYRMWLK